MARHLDENELLLAAMGHGGEATRAHLAECSECRAQVDSRAKVTPAPEAGEEEDPGPIPWTQDGDMAALEDEPVAVAVERGTMVGRYLILSELGQGGMGVVYAAHDQELDRKVAVKLLKPGKTGDGHARLLREAQAMARVSHPNVLPVFDVGAYGEQVFVAMEFVDGGTLKDWIKKKPAWRDVLQKFLAAGRGLASAHEAGLVHRDFKPDNVLVHKDGRVFVTDFGLARLVSDTRPELPREPTETKTGARLSEQLTQAGVVMGTPAYMAPEQHLGRNADARTDQFSFAAALYWGLWRKRPFDPQRLAAAAAMFDDASTEVRSVTRTSGLRRRPQNDVVQAPPPTPKVPAWLRDAVLKALSLNPEDRYPSMDALLSELEKRIAVNRRSTWAAAGAVTLLAAATAVVGYRQVEARAQLCSGGPRLLVGAWDASVRGSVERAFTATGASGAVEQAQRAAAVLDGYSLEWVGMHREACEAARVRQEQSDEVLTLRMACLDRRLQELRSLSGLFMAADAKLVGQSVDAALQLSSVRHCANVTALTGRAPLPMDPAQRAEIDRVTAVLAEANALRMAGRFTEALQKISPERPATEKLRYRPLEAEVLYLQGISLDRTGKLPEGEEALVSAFFAADAGRDDTVKAQAANRLLYASSQQARFGDAQRWAAAARAAIERLGGSRELEADMLSVLGNIQLGEGKAEQALATLTTGLQLITVELGKDAPKRAVHLGNVGNALVQLGRNDEAITVLTEAISSIERVRGPDHPGLAPMLYSVTGALLSTRRFAEAHTAVDRAIAIARARNGPNHPRVGSFLDRKASVYQEEGRFEEALGAYRAALAIKRASLPERNPELSYSLDGIGQCLLGLGRPREAVAPLEEALSVRSPEPIGLAETRFALAKTLVALNRDRARAAKLAGDAQADFVRGGQPSRGEQVAQWLSSAGAGGPAPQGR